MRRSLALFATLLILAACDGDTAPGLDPGSGASREPDVERVESSTDPDATGTDTAPSPTMARGERTSQADPTTTPEPEAGSPPPHELVERTVLLRGVVPGTTPPRVQAFAELQLGLRKGPLYVPLGTWNTGPRGIRSVTVRVPAGRSLYLWGQPVQEGYARRPSQVILLAEGETELAVQMVRGTTAAGRLLAPDGSAVSGPLWVLQAGRPVGTARFLGSTDDPRFEFDVPARGSFRLAASVPGIGTAVAEDLVLDPAVPAPQDLVLRLEGPGRVAGCLRDVHGDTLPDVAVLAVQDAPDLDPDLVAFPGEEDVRPGGLRWSAGRTDERGRFELTGLAPGRYHLRADALERNGEDHPWYTLKYLDRTEPGTVPHDGPERDHTVALHRVHVRVLDPRGTPIAFEPRKHVPGTAYVEELHDIAGRDTSIPKAVVRAEDAEDLERSARGDWLWVPTEDATEWELRALPAHAYLVALQAERTPLATARVEVVEGAYDQDLAIRLPSRPDLGRVVLHVEVPEPDPSLRGSFGWPLGLRTSLLSLPDEFELAVEEVALGEPLDLELPPGRYRLVAAIRGAGAFCGNGLEDDDYLVTPRPVAFEFEIASNQLLERDLAFRPRARVFVRVDGAEPGTLPPGGPVRVLARSSDGVERTLTFRQQVQGLGNDAALAYEDVDWIVPTWRKSCEDDLDPGTYTLWAELADHVGDPVEVELHGSEIRRLDLVLRPR